jgi:hypothetical protein
MPLFYSLDYLTIFARPSVRTFVNDVLADVSWRPDPVFLMDICAAEGRLYVLELNSFSCSGLYACDPEAVVKVVSSQGVWAWQCQHTSGME